MVAGATYLLVAENPEGLVPAGFDAATLGGATMIIGATVWYLSHRKLKTL